MAEKTFYEILGIRSDATPEEVRAAFDRLAARPAEKAQLDAINEAFATLSDPLKRAKYDMSLEVREKPASEQIEAVAPMWTMRTVVAIAVFVVLAGVAYYFYEENEARLESEKVAAAMAAAKAKEAEEKAKIADQEAARYERQRLEEARAASARAKRQMENAPLREEEERRQRVHRENQQKAEDMRRAQTRYLDGVSDVMQKSGVNYPAPPADSGK